MGKTVHSVVSCVTIGAVLGLSVAPAPACTRVLWNENKLAVVSGRSMDWPESTEPKLTVFPRGLQRNGGKVGPAVVVADNPATWTSEYGSIVTTVYGIGTVDGINERGLGTHMLYLTATDFGPRDAGKPGIAVNLWAQYLLDNAATVAEALALLEDVQIIMAEARGRQGTVHLALEDASGDSAIVEYVAGERRVHHGREFRIMTNDPTYDEQLALLKAQDFSKPSSDMPLPGNVNARDRFQRAAYYAALLPEPKDERAAVAGILAIIRNVSVPFGAPYKGFGIYNTEYRTAMDLTNRRYFFELTTSPNVVWADLAKFDLSPGAPVMLLDPDDIDLSGDVSAKFQTAERPF
ncbi:linear amide C-N hydrolase [Hyphomicrobium sp.]|uniref:linear amide C-N hydrolase n=1 Tax=Hyphomicrobium sp. TaxID=82 RepID=UPI0025C1CC44|nr:linear amide C-N hydrolase [Hyphomicrobium sp.]MCC7252999.1 linear amide C-N hydrolase [Hyphomicrobium sp.]